MAQFASGIVQVNSSVGTIASMVWNPGNTSATTFGSLGSVPSTSSFSGLIIANTGSNTIYLSSGSLNALAAQGTVGVPVPAGGECYLSGYSGTVGTAGTIWAVTLGVGNTSSSQAGLPSVASVI